MINFQYSYAYAQIGSFALPIPQALALFTVVLPLITGISTQSVGTLMQKSSREKRQLTLPILAIIGFTLMYDTAIAVLALTHILPPSALSCGLNERWTKLYIAKDARGIRAIQDAFECCGFKTVKDRAFPFTSNSPSTCAADFRRSQSCLAPWRGAEQWTAGLLLLVAVAVFLIKVYLALHSVVHIADTSRFLLLYPFLLNHLGDLRIGLELCFPTDMRLSKTQTRNRINELLFEDLLKTVPVRQHTVMNLQLVVLWKDLRVVVMATLETLHEFNLRSLLTLITSGDKRVESNDIR